MNLTKSSDSTNPSSIGSIDIWFAEIHETTRCIEQKTEVLLSNSEKARLSAIKNPRKRREYLLSRALMRHGLAQKFSQDEGFWIFQDERNHSPKITNLPQLVYTSLSHSKGLIGFALAENTIGIDLEVIKDGRDFTEFTSIVMTEGEIYYLNEDPSEYILRFYKLWCSKEALYKTLSPKEQTHTHLSDLCVMQSGNSHLILNKFENYMFSIASNVWPVKINHFVFPDTCKSRLLSKIQNLSNNYHLLPQGLK